MKTKIIYGTIILALVIMLGCSSQITGAAITEKDSYTIGAILPLTEDLAFVGQEMQRGIDIGVEEVNANGGIQGKPLKVIFEDDGMIDPRKAVTAAHKLLNFDNVDASIITMVEDAKPIAPIYELTNVPLMVLWDVTDDLRNYQNTFSIGFYTEKAGEKMANFAYNDLELRKVAMVVHQDEWAITISSAFERKFTELGGEVLFTDFYSLDDNDYRNFILKAKARNADAVYAPLIPPISAQFFKQKVELDLEVPILAGDALTPDVWQLAPEGVEGTYFTNVFETTTHSAINLKNKYINKHNEEPLAFPLVQMGYDAVKVYAKAMENTKTSKEIIDNLHNIEQFEVSGLPVSFDEDGMANKQEKIFQIQNNDQVLIQA